MSIENTSKVNKKEKSYSSMLMTQRIFRTVISVFLCILSLFPFYIMIINSTRASVDIQQGLALLPSGEFMNNVNKLLAKSASIKSPLWKCMMNSATIAIPATLFTVYFSSMTAYGIYVYNFKVRKFAWSFILAIMMIPQQVSIIGFYKFMLTLGLNDSYIPLIIPAIAAPSTVFFMRQYMKSALPLEIIDAARIDGSNEFHTFNRISVPLMKPAIATQAIFAFILSWNNLFTPNMILNSPDKNTLPMFIQQLRSEQFRTDYGMIYVGLFLTVLPIFIVYFSLSKYIIAGVALGGVKE
jgi:multiple sugar transport system permease protein